MTQGEFDVRFPADKTIVSDATATGVARDLARLLDEVIPVTLRSVEADRGDIGKLESLNIFSQTSGHSVPLKQVADIEVVWQPAKILRRDRLKTVTVTAGIEAEVTAIGIFKRRSRLFAERRGRPISTSKAMCPRRRRWGCARTAARNGR